MKNKWIGYDWDKFVNEEIPYVELIRLSLEVMRAYRKTIDSIKDMKVREQLEKYIEDCLLVLE